MQVKFAVGVLSNIFASRCALLGTGSLWRLQHCLPTNQQLELLELLEVRVAQLERLTGKLNVTVPVVVHCFAMGVRSRPSDHRHADEPLERTGLLSTSARFQGLQMSIGSLSRR